METILGDAMFEVPGSSVRYVLVTEQVAKREEGAIYLGRGQGGKFHSLIAQEEGEWDEKHKPPQSKDDDDPPNTSFEHWRANAAAGSGG